MNEFTRKQLLVRAITCFVVAIIVIIFMILSGCASQQQWQGVCRQKVLFAGSVVGEHHDVYVLRGKVKGMDEYHVQAFLPLVVDGDTVRPGKLEFHLEDISIMNEAEYKGHASAVEYGQRISNRQ